MHIYTTRLSDKTKSWTSSFASVKESLPQTSREVKQKLHSWSRSFSRHDPRQKQEASTLSSHHRSHMYPRPSANKFNSSTREATSVPFGRDSVVSLRAKITEPTAALTDKFKSTTSNARDVCPVFGQSIPEHIDRRLSDPSVLETSPSVNTKAKGDIGFAEATSCLPPAAVPDLHRSASFNSLTSHIRSSVKRLRDSASNVSLRKMYVHSSAIERDNQHPQSTPSRHSAPPAGYRNTIQRSYSSTDFLHPHQLIDSQEPMLESIAEHCEMRQPQLQPHGDDFRQDMIFALHESRVCRPQAPPIFVEKLSFSSAGTRRNSVVGFDELERSISQPRRRSMRRQDRMSSSTMDQLMKQIERTNDMAALRQSINDTRALCRLPTLEFHQDLCGQAEIVATKYEIQYGYDGNCWGTEIQVQEGSATLELVGPPGVGGRVTGKMWADGRYSRHTQSSHAQFSLHDHEQCQCHNFKVWQAITDVRWRAIGLSRTVEEERWVVVLSQ